MARAKRHYIASFDDYDRFRLAHRECVESSLANGRNVCDSRWTRSVAVEVHHSSGKSRRVLGGRLGGGGCARCPAVTNSGNSWIRILPVSALKRAK